MVQEVYEEEELLEEDELVDGDDEEEGSFAAALQEQMGQAPWYVSSLAIHFVIFLIMILFFDPPERQSTRRRVEIKTQFEEPEEEEEELEEVKPEIEEKDPEIITESEVTVETPVVTTTDVEIADHFETDDNMDNNTALGDPDNFSDVDSEFVGTPALMGVGASGGSGGGGRFGFRNGGGKRNALRRGGGSARTEAAVDWALRWLAEHQEYDGHWDCNKYGGKGGHAGKGEGKANPGDVAVTSLATLAFLGAGNSTKFGKYRDNVRRAAEWLQGQQLASGQIGRHRYEAGIATMAISELYGMSNDSQIKKAAQRAVDHAVKSQCPAGGWDYSPSAKRNDTSVAGWWIMGLKSAKVAGLHVPSDTMEKALKYLEKATTPEGSTSYSSTADTVDGVKAGGGSHRMTVVALTCMQFLGRDRDHNLVVATAKKGSARLPNMAKFDFYEWYYQALGLFQMGVKSDYWRRFNPIMRDALLATQVKEGTFKENKGSWNPDTDPYGDQWGRVGQTAIGALMLEVYYRYHEIEH